MLIGESPYMDSSSDANDIAILNQYLEIAKDKFSDLEEKLKGLAQYGEQIKNDQSSLRQCEYCLSKLRVDNYKKHLDKMHPDRLSNKCKSIDSLRVDLRDEAKVRGRM